MRGQYVTDEDDMIGLSDFTEYWCGFHLGYECHGLGRENCQKFYLPRPQ
jgi:hypothetical protein